VWLTETEKYEISMENVSSVRTENMNRVKHDVRLDCDNIYLLLTFGNDNSDLN